MCSQNADSLIIKSVSNRTSIAMDYLNFLILFIPFISCDIPSKIQEICDVDINEDGLPFGSDELTGSPLYLKQLSDNEEIIHAYVQRDYYNSKDLTYCQRHFMQRYLLHFDSSTGKLTHSYKDSGEAVSSRAHNVAWNPIATFLMMRRFRSFLLPLVASVNVTSQQELFTTITQMMSNSRWPSTTSLNASIDAILRIQQVHDLATADVAEGKLENESTGLRISPEECAMIAERALNERVFALAIEWFEQAIAASAAHQESYARNLKDANHAHDSHCCENSSASVEDLQYFFTTKVAEVAVEKRVRQRTQLVTKWEDDYETFPLYWGLCSGNDYQTTEEKSRLFCYYESRRHTYLAIGPIKTEVLALDPIFVLQFYEVLDDRAIRKLQQEASAGLQHSTLGDDDGYIELSTRSSIGVFIQDHFREDIKLGRIVEMLTGMKVRASVTASEDLQVAAYASGSHYLMHYDESPQDENSPVDTPIRIATFLFYLSDVVKGGGTSFIQGRVAASPVKGSALLWFNLLKSSENDDNSMHGACPVVIGEKWISTKWIYYHEQAFQPGYQCVREEYAQFNLNDIMN